MEKVTQKPSFVLFSPAKKRRNILAPQKNDLLIDIEAKLREGKGNSYERWVKVHNLKQAVQTINYLREHGLHDYNELKEKTTDVNERCQ